MSTLADNLIINVLCPLLWCAIGTFLFWQTLSKGKHPVDLIVLFVSLTLITIGLALPFLDLEISILTYSSTPVSLEFVHTGMHILANFMLLLFLFLFPDGRFLPRWMLVPVCIFLILSVCPIFFPAWSLTSWIIRYRTQFDTLIPVLGLISQLSKYRLVTTPLQRRRIRWVVACPPRASWNPPL